MIYDAQGVQQEEREEPTENLHAGGSSPERMDPDSPDRSPSGQQQPRDKWANKSEFLFSMAGVINGLENVWIFPYLCYENGGGKKISQQTAAKTKTISLDIQSYHY